MKAGADSWQQQHPNGIVAYRKYSDSPKTYTLATVNEGWIGNPFSVQTRGKDTVQKFYEWLYSLLFFAHHYLASFLIFQQ